MITQVTDVNGSVEIDKRYLENIEGLCMGGGIALCCRQDDIGRVLCRGWIFHGGNLLFFLFHGLHIAGQLIGIEKVGGETQIVFFFPACGVIRVYSRMLRLKSLLPIFPLRVSIFTKWSTPNLIFPLMLSSR